MRGFGFGLLVGGILGAVAVTALAGDPQRREQLRERSIELKQRADTEIANLRTRAEGWREPVQRVVIDSVEAARRTSEELTQRLSRAGEPPRNA
jgi:gas vesicle protein